MLQSRNSIKIAPYQSGHSDRGGTPKTITKKVSGYAGIVTRLLPSVKKGFGKLIDEVLNKTVAIELFEKEAILFGTSDVIPFYRAIELFGEEAAMFFDRTIKFEGYLKGGEDYSAWGACTDERPITNYLYKAGFLKLVTEHNYLRVVKAHKESEGGRIFDRYWEERSRRIEEAEVEEERKRTERKAKRAAAKAAREAAEKEKGGNS